MLSRIISHSSSRTAACCRLPNTLLLRTATRPRGRPLPAIRVRRVTTTVADRVKNKLKLADDGYPLMEGSLMSRIHQEARKKMPQWILFHGSKLLVLVSCFTLDWVVLRSALIASSLGSIAFHGLFPSPRPIRMLWGGVFCVGHLYSLWLHLRESFEWSLEPEELKIFEEMFEKHGFSRWHFKLMMEKAVIYDVQAGQNIYNELDVVEKLPFILEGEANWTLRKPKIDHGLNISSFELRQRDRVKWQESPLHMVGTCGELSCGGELWDKDYYSPATLEKMKAQFGDEEHRWSVSLTATKPTKVLQFPKKWLHRLIEEDPHLRAAATEYQLRSVWEARRSVVGKLQQAKLEIRRLEQELQPQRGAGAVAAEGGSRQGGASVPRHKGGAAAESQDADAESDSSDE